jgi:hypothetical protein
MKRIRKPFMKLPIGVSLSAAITMMKKRKAGKE